MWFFFNRLPSLNLLRRSLRIPKGFVDLPLVICILHLSLIWKCVLLRYPFRFTDPIIIFLSSIVLYHHPQLSHIGILPYGSASQEFFFFLRVGKLGIHPSVVLNKMKIHRLLPKFCSVNCWNLSTSNWIFQRRVWLEEQISVWKKKEKTPWYEQHYVNLKFHAGYRGQHGFNEEINFERRWQTSRSKLHTAKGNQYPKVRTCYPLVFKSQLGTKRERLVFVRGFFLEIGKSKLIYPTPPWVICHWHSTTNHATDFPKVSLYFHSFDTL